MFLLRDVRLGAAARWRRRPRPPGDPVDVRVVRRTGGRGRRDLARPGGVEEVRRRRALADARPVGPARAPRPVDAGLPAARPDRHPLGRGRAGPGGHAGSPRAPTCPSSAGGTAPPRGTGSRPSRELDEVTGVRPVVLISGDGHHAWLNTVALRGLGLPERDGVVSEAEWFQAYPRLGRLVGTDGTSPDAYLHTMQQAAAKGVVGLVDLEFDQSADGLARARGRRRRAAARPGRGVRRHAGRLPRRGRAHRRADARLRPAGHDGSAEDHLRRVAEHPHGVVLLGVRRRRRHRRAEHHQRGPARRDGGGQPAPPRGGDPRDRRRRRRAGAQGVRGHRCRGVDRARPADRPRGLARDGRGSASARACSRRTCSTTATSPRASGPTAPSAASRCAGCTTTASSSPWAATPPCRRWTRGSRSPPPCTAAPTSASRGTPSRR